MIVRRALAALAVGAMLSTSAVGCGDPTAASDVEVEVEDCDAEDFAKRESDCGFSDADRKKTPAPKKTPAKRR